MVSTRIATSRIAARYVMFRRFSSGGKVFSEEEKAAENVYIRKMEQERSEKLARERKDRETQAARSRGSGSVGGGAVDIGIIANID